MMKKGFTLAEVLITLVIIGVVASMTIPTLMNSTQGTEYKTGFKKAMSTLNQAFSLNYAITATLPGEDDYASNKGMLDYFFKKRLSVISTATSTSAFATGDGVSLTASNDNNVFYTSDGMRYVFNIDNASGVADSTGDKYYGTILVDVNGEKGPNTLTTDATNPKDTYVMTFYGTRVVAGIPGKEDGASGAAKTIMMEKKTKESTRNNS